VNRLLAKLEWASAQSRLRSLFASQGSNLGAVGKHQPSRNAEGAALAREMMGDPKLVLLSGDTSTRLKLSIVFQVLKAWEGDRSLSARSWEGL